MGLGEKTVQLTKYTRPAPRDPRRRPGAVRKRGGGTQGHGGWWCC
jgi:hypothetical protein